MQLAGAIANCALHERTIEAAEERAAMEHLQSANKELAIANEIKAQLISNVSHELRTPLTSMLAFADMLNRDRQGVLTDQYKDMVRLIRRSGRQLDLLISDLLMMSRLQTGEFKLSYEQFRLQDLVDEVAGVISSITESKRQPINIELDDPQLLIEADRSRVAQVLLNILSNASKYSDEGSPIGLKATEEGGRALLSVQDHGHGISAEEKSRIFQRFSRLDNDATRGAPGTGLGLSIVKTLVDLHCGSVEVESEPGAGTTFTVAIPLKAVGAHSERAA
jgi:signal transduction histidine kinase